MIIVIYLVLGDLGQFNYHFLRHQRQSWLRSLSHCFGTTSRCEAAKIYINLHHRHAFSISARGAVLINVCLMTSQSKLETPMVSHQHHRSGKLLSLSTEHVARGAVHCLRARVADRRALVALWDVMSDGGWQLVTYVRGGNVTCLSITSTSAAGFRPITEQGFSLPGCQAWNKPGLLT